jgi:hypothetical protein
MFIEIAELMITEGKRVTPAIIQNRIYRQSSNTLYLFAAIVVLQTTPVGLSVLMIFIGSNFFKGLLFW